MIRDISPSGALLRVPLDFAMTGQILISAESVGQDRRAYIVRSDGSSIGVSFED